MNDGIAKSSASRRVVAGVAIAAASFTGIGGVTVVAPEYAAQAQAAESGIWKYEVVGDHVELQGLTDEGKKKVQDNGGKLPDFPLEIEGKKVTSIGNRAFYINQITKLPDDWGNITYIGSNAFSSNQITSLPESWGEITSIGKGVFWDNQITSLPDDWGKITSIGKSAFYENQITSLPDDWGKITSIGGYAFSGNQITSLPDWSTLKILQDSKENPEISSAARCTRQPLNVALIFDTSGSIQQDGIDKYKQSTSDFVDNVSDKGISLASFDFSSDANAPKHLSKPEPLLVTKDTKDDVKASINEHFELKDETNWESGLISARDNNTVTDGKPRYDLVIFISDGFPNRKVTEEDISDMQAAQKVANQLKEQGSKVISMGVGVGQNLSNGKISGLFNLLPLSGTRENNDYYLGDWDELASMLTHSTQNVTCGTQVDASAQIIDKDGKITDPSAQGFEFSAEVTKSKYDNVTVVGEPKKTTPNALWSFPFNFNDKTGDDLRESTADITITQKPKDGFTFLSGEYKIVNNEDGEVISTGSLTGDSTVVKDVPADAHVQVVAKYRDSSVTPDTKQSDKHNPGYKPAETTPGTAVDIEQTGDKEIPEGTKFGTPDKTPKGWEVKVDEKTGKVTATPPKDAKPGDKAEFTVPVTYPDGSKDEAPVIVTVKDKGDNTPGEDPSTKPSTSKPGDDGSTSAKPSTSKPGDDGSTSAKPSTSKPGDDGNPSTSKPGDDDVTSTKPSDSKPGDDKPGDDGKPSISKPGDDDTSKPGDGTPGDDTPSTSKPGDKTPKPSNTDNVDNDNSSSKPSDTGEGNDNTNSSGDGSASEQKPSTHDGMNNQNSTNNTTPPAGSGNINSSPGIISGGYPPVNSNTSSTDAQVSSGKSHAGPVVHTGGSVEKETFWEKIINLFR